MKNYVEIHFWLLKTITKFSLIVFKRSIWFLIIKDGNFVKWILKIEYKKLKKNQGEKQTEGYFYAVKSYLTFE